MTSLLQTIGLGAGKHGAKIISILSGIHCCHPCILRYLGIREVKTHQQVIPSLHRINIGNYPTSIAVPKSDETDENEPASKRIAVEVEENKDNVDPSCPACLGLLQMDFDHLAQQTWSAFSGQNYLLNHNTFCISNRLPPQLALRHQSIIRLLHHEIFGTTDRVPSSPKMTVIDGVKRQISTSILDESDSLPPAVEVKEVLKYLISKALASGSDSPWKYSSNSPFVIGYEMSHPETEFDYEFMIQIPHAKFNVTKSQKKGKIIYKGASAERIAKTATFLSFEDYLTHNYCPPPKLSSRPVIESLKFHHESIFVAGRYCKLQRHISNSPWEIKGKRMTEDSVEELIGDHLDPFFTASGHKFSSAGREDADVLMLGKGRPFYFEMIDPHRLGVDQEALTELSKKINAAANGKIRVRDLQIVPKEEIRILKDSASTKSKSYVCLVKLSEKVSVESIKALCGTKDLNISQRNPTRVPRRADLVRSKVIEDMEIDPLFEDDEESNKTSTDSLRVHLKTSAGTYVKEFVHSDGGRTEPSIKSLLSVSEAQCVQLDVSEVHLDWPPYLENTT